MEPFFPYNYLHYNQITKNELDCFSFPERPEHNFFRISDAPGEIRGLLPENNLNRQKLLKSHF
jgi:hypothetical protein